MENEASEARHISKFYFFSNLNKIYVYFCHKVALNSFICLNYQIIKDSSQTLPAYQFLTAFSQIISRICHPSPSVWEILEVSDLLRMSKGVSERGWDLFGDVI